VCEIANLAILGQIVRTSFPLRDKRALNLDELVDDFGLGQGARYNAPLCWCLTHFVGNRPQRRVTPRKVACKGVESNLVAKVGLQMPRQWHRAASLTSVFAELTSLIKSYINFCTIAVFGSPCDISGIRRYPPLGRNARGTVWSCSGNFSLFQAKMTLRQERRHPKL
jgi:hypothetical protein